MKTYDDTLAALDETTPLLEALRLAASEQREIVQPPRRLRLPPHLIDKYEAERDASPHRFSSPAL